MLNINQTKAVMTKDRFVFLLAGAGTGKTRVIVERAKRLIKEGISASNILIISFTRKSVKDIIVKLNDNAITVTTYHGFCYSHLSQFKTIELAIKDELIDAGFNNDQLRVIDINKRSNKNTLLTKKYNLYLKKYNLLDFTDLEIVFFNLLKKDCNFRNKITTQYKYIFIDEFQDTSLMQFYLLEMLVTKKTYLFCVGDPNQAIYFFRGANDKIIKRYINKFKANIYFLDLNYRSSKYIINAANNIINQSNSIFKNKLHYIKKDFGHLKVKYFDSYLSQISYIDTEVRKHLKRFKQYEIAIIYRNHHIGVKLKEHFFNTYYEDLNFYTIHQAKGLEFEVVFFIGLEEGNLPMTSINVKEERNLFYVGVTRAKTYLYLCSVVSNSRPSRFIKECF